MRPGPQDPGGAWYTDDHGGSGSEPVVFDTGRGELVRCFRWRRVETRWQRLWGVFREFLASGMLERLDVQGERWLGWSEFRDIGEVFGEDLGVFLIDTAQRWWAPVYRKDDSLLAWWWEDGFPVVLTAVGVLRFDRAASRWRFDRGAWTRIDTLVPETGLQRCALDGTPLWSGGDQAAVLMGPPFDDARFLLIADAAGTQFQRMDLEVPGGGRILSVGPATRGLGQHPLHIGLP